MISGNLVLDPAQCLAEILAEENAALKRLDFPAAVALVPAKEAALAKLAASSAPARPAALAQHLASLASENQILLERAITVQTRIVRIIAKAAAPPPAAIRYNTQGRPPPCSRTDAMALSTRA